MPVLEDVTGQRFGRLTVISRAPNKGNRIAWKCLCDCGNFTEVKTYHLKSEDIRSCGCYGLERSIQASTTHGLSRSEKKMYKLWNSIKSRCYIPSDTSYKNYGARGITMCNEWLGSFESFLAYMGPHPGKKFSIDRINNNRGYEPGNVRWASRTQQNRNTRKNIFMTYNNETKCLSEFASEYNIPYLILYKRIQRGWTLEKALHTPVVIMDRNVIYQGKKRTLAECAKIAGLSYSGFCYRLKRGWSIEKAISTPPEPQVKRNVG